MTGARFYSCRLVSICGPLFSLPPSRWLSNRHSVRRSRELRRNLASFGDFAPIASSAPHRLHLSNERRLRSRRRANPLLALPITEALRARVSNGATSFSQNRISRSRSMKIFFLERDFSLRRRCAREHPMRSASAQIHARGSGRKNVGCPVIGIPSACSELFRHRTALRAAIGRDAEVISAGRAASRADPSTATRGLHQPEGRQDRQRDSNGQNRGDDSVRRPRLSERCARRIVPSPEPEPQGRVKEIGIRPEIPHQLVAADSNWRLWPQPNVKGSVFPPYPRRVPSSVCREVHRMVKAHPFRSAQVFVHTTPEDNPVA